jgi:multidrug resistance efflux pump
MSEAVNTAKKPGKLINIILVIVALLIIIGLGIWYYFYWQGTHYFSTENAKVTAETYTITPTSSGKLVKYNIQDGSIVKENDVIGRVEDGANIRSPINGLVVEADATLNQMVSPATPVAVIANTDDVYVGANVEETDIRNIKVGQSVTVSLDAYPGQKFNGHVSEISSITQSALTGSLVNFSTSGTYTKVTQLLPVKIVLDDNVNIQQLIGTNATVKIRIK